MEKNEKKILPPASVQETEDSVVSTIGEITVEITKDGIRLSAP